MQHQMSVQDIYLSLTAIGEAAALKVQNFNLAKSKKVIVSLPKTGKNAGKKWMIDRKTGNRTRVCANEVQKYVAQGYVFGMK